MISRNCRRPDETVTIWRRVHLIFKASQYEFLIQQNVKLWGAEVVVLRQGRVIRNINSEVNQLENAYHHWREGRRW